MNSKFPVFVIMASILTMAIYSSSINFVSAKGVVTESSGCMWEPSAPNRASCSSTKGGVTTNYNCTYDPATKKWSCVKARTISGTPNQMPDSQTLNKMTDSQIPLGLKSALDSAIKSQNGGLVVGQSNAQDSNSSEMKVGNSPNPPQCPNTGPIPPDCTMKPPVK